MSSTIFTPDSNKTILIGKKAFSNGSADFSNIPAGFHSFLFYYTLISGNGLFTHLIQLNGDANSLHYPLQQTIVADSTTLSASSGAVAGFVLASLTAVGIQSNGMGEISNFLGAQKVNFNQLTHDNNSCYLSFTGVFNQTAEVNRINFVVHASDSGQVALYGVKD